MRSNVKRQTSNAGAKRRGFTLIELLVTTTIIGLLASVGTVSYSFVRVKARDTKRVADIRTIRNAIELYFDQHGQYPPAPPEGLILGTPEAAVISDAGITPEGGQGGNVYLRNVPGNVQPGGVPYLYRSVHADGTPCAADCFSFAVFFELEVGAGELVAGPHLLSDRGVEGAETGHDAAALPGFLQFIPAAELRAAARDAAELAALVRGEVIERPEVQAANRNVLAPVAAAAVAVNLAAAAASAAPLASMGQVFFLLFLQPFQAVGRKKKAGWGTVYDAGTKVPVDLASVRLVEAATGRSVGSKVTDRNGRYAFAPKAGTYRLEVVKPGYVFPSPSLRGRTEDGRFHALYFGTLFAVEEDGRPVAFDIPVEHEKAPPEESRELLSERNKKAFRKAVALSGPLLGGIGLAVTPSPLMLLLFLVHLAVYVGFKRLAMPEEPKNHGVVYDEETKDPIPKAVVRILSAPYHKVLETKLTDAKGRYSFHVGHGNYYLTVTKPGFAKTETDEIDFSGIDKPTFLASDLPMRKLEKGKNA